MSTSRLIVVLVLFLSGCAASGPTFTPAEKLGPNEGLVYIHRDNGFGLGGRTAYFYINGVNIFDLDRKGYSWISLPAGHYTLRQKWPADVTPKSLSIELDIEAGQTRYFGFGTDLCSDRCIQYELHEQQPSVGRATIAEKHFQPNFGAAKLREVLSR
jgi:hypothetical protein